MNSGTDNGSCVAPADMFFLLVFSADMLLTGLIQLWHFCIIIGVIISGMCQR